MDRTDCNRLVRLLVLTAPLFFAACTQRDSAHSETASANEPITVGPLPEVVVTASRLPPEGGTDEDERRLAARRDR